MNITRIFFSRFCPVDRWWTNFLHFFTVLNAYHIFSQAGRFLKNYTKFEKDLLVIWIIIGFFVYLNINVYIYVSGSCFHPVMSFAIVDKCLFSDTSSDDRIQCIEKEIVFDFFFFNMRCVLREITLRDVNFYVNVFQFSKHICLCKSTHTHTHPIIGYDPCGKYNNH